MTPPLASHLGADGFAVFLFHGVIPEHRHPVRNYTRKHMALDRFRAVLDELEAHGRPVSMADVVRASLEGAPLPPRAFAITFDDGFANNATVAAPELRARGLPATFYVTTDFVDHRTGSWTDLIEQAVEVAPVCRLDLGPGLEGVWRSSAEKRLLLELVRARVKGDPTIDPYAFAAAARLQLGSPVTADDPDLDLKLTWDELRALAQDPLFEVGGHGRTHRILSFLDDAALEAEISWSLARLRSELGTPVEHYSYPEGLTHCYSPRVIESLRRHGIRCSPTALPGTNRAGDDLFHLRRVSVEG